jgi:hypothetical protein
MDQRLDAPDLEGDRAPDNYSDYPVVGRRVRGTPPQKSSLGVTQAFTKNFKTPTLRLRAFD